MIVFEMSDTVELKYDGRSYEMSHSQLRTTNIGWSKYIKLCSHCSIMVNNVLENVNQWKFAVVTTAFGT